MTAGGKLRLALGRGVATAAITVAVAVIGAVLALGLALALGYRPVVITGGSMGATVPDGALVVARPRPQVDVGQVLVMRQSGRATITHRVVRVEPGVDGGPSFAITRGDANPQPDPAPYPLRGRQLVARWVVPGLGATILDLANPVAGTALIGTVVAILVLAALRRIWRPRAGPDDRGEAEGETETKSPGRGRKLRVGGVVALAVVLGLGGVAWALYVDGAAVPGNAFSAKDCYQARLSGVQKGQAVNTANGTQTVTISTVDPARSFLVFTVRSTGNEPDDSRVLGQLASATTVTFARNTNNGSPPAITIEWSVVSYACGVSVQRGTLATNGTTQMDVAIPSVNLSSSFVLGTSVPDATAQTFGDNDLITYQLTSSTNLRVRSASEAPIGSAAFGWQVVTFTDPADASVQTVSASLAAGVGTTTVDLATPVDLQSTFVVASPASSSGGVEMGERALRVRLVDADTVEVYRAATTETAAATVQVVSLAEGSTVQRGLLTMNPSETSVAAAINPVDTARSTAFTTVMEPGALSMGATSYTADDVVGEASATAVVSTPTAVTLQRNSSAATASFAWQVITWGGPSWADTSYGFRQRLDITAGAVDAPNGYTASVAVNHQALVASGLSLASGDDVRLWRFDGTSWAQLDRVIDAGSSWNSATTTLWFRTQESIAAATTVSYWLYYGNHAPASPLADPDNVWLLREGFEAGLGHFADQTSGTGWYAADPWTRRITLAVAHSAVTSTLSGQAVLVRLTSADLAAQAQSDGSDIRFTAADGTTPLNHEIESYDAATGTLTTWVSVPTLDSATDTTLHLYYGAADAPAQANPRAVWTNEVAAWHLARSRTGPAPSLDDASTTNLDGLALGDTALVDAASGAAADLDGTTDRLEASPHDLPDGPLTVAAWFQPDTVTGSPVLVSQGDPTGTGVFELAVVNGTARFRLRTGGTLTEVAGGTVTAGAWNEVAATWNGTTVTLYANGTSVATGTATGATPDGTALATVLGGDPAGTRTLDGRLGEARISARAWSASEVRFFDQNLRNPATTVTASAAATGSWLSQGTWSTRRPITVSAAVAAGNLTDYPLLVQLSDAQLAAAAQADGDDLVFVTADGITRLDYDLESWNPATGALTAWVRIPSLSPTADTKLFLYVGNASARAQEDPVAVWGANADLVVNG